MGDHVEQLRVVFADGEIADLGREPWPAYDEEPADFKDVIVRKLAARPSAEPKRLTAADARRRPATAPATRLGRAAGRRRESTWPGWSAARRGRSRCVTAGDPADRPHPGGAGGRAPPVRPAGRRRRSATALPGIGARALGLRPLRLAVAQPGPRRRSRFRAWIPEAAESVLIVEFEGDDPEEVAGKVRAARSTG